MSTTMAGLRAVEIVSANIPYLFGTCIFVLLICLIIRYLFSYNIFVGEAKIDD